VPSAISSTALAILPEATKKRILSITPAVAPAVTDPAEFPYSFSVTFSSMHNEIAALTAAQKDGAQSIGLLAVDDETGRTFLDRAGEHAAEMGLDVVGSEAFPIDSRDVTANLQQLRDEGAEALVVYPPGATIGVLMSGVADLGWDVPIHGTAAAITGDIAELVPEASADQLEAITTRLAARFDEERSPTTKERLNAIIEQGEEVTSMTNAATGVEVIAVMKYAFEKAGEFDGAAATKALEGMAADPDIPEDTFFLFSNSHPGYDENNHRPDNADYTTGFWAKVWPSELIDGTLEGEPFDLN
jgi:ABC-type branched-subunit amino acid transport system substrate-binding protein